MGPAAPKGRAPRLCKPVTIPNPPEKKTFGNLPLHTASANVASSSTSNHWRDEPRCTCRHRRIPRHWKSTHYSVSVVKKNLWALPAATAGHQAHNLCRTLDLGSGPCQGELHDEASSKWAPWQALRENLCIDHAHMMVGDL